MFKSDIFSSFFLFLFCLFLKPGKPTIGSYANYFLYVTDLDLFVSKWAERYKANFQFPKLVDIIQGLI